MSIRQPERNESPSNEQEEDLSIDEQDSFTVAKMIELGRHKIFPKKFVFMDQLKKSYTPVLHFFDHQSEFEEAPEKMKVKFICKIDGCVKYESFGALTNLNKHLLTHQESAQWYQSYIKSKKSYSKPALSDAKLNLIKFFITSNLALSQLENVYLRKCLKDEIALPCVKTFRFTFLNEILELLHGTIQNKCQEASFITLIPDPWSDEANTNFLGN